MRRAERSIVVNYFRWSVILVLVATAAGFVSAFNLVSFRVGWIIVVLWPIVVVLMILEIRKRAKEK